jgi:hypothetical protein
MKCICCGNRIKNGDNTMSLEESVFLNEPPTRSGGSWTRAENLMWTDGVVGNISGGFGSDCDGDKFVIAICDVCVKIKLNDGSLAYTGNYMFSNEEDPILSNIEKYKKIWRRNNNLDNLDI